MFLFGLGWFWGGFFWVWDLFLGVCLGVLVWGVGFLWWVVNMCVEGIFSCLGMFQEQALGSKPRPSAG